MSAPRDSRNVTAILGPTNTGKTHLAIERMLGHQSGMIGLPLRLLAREVFDKVAARAGAANVALITGEEKIKPASPRYWVCTVEAMPIESTADFVAVDEIQLAADGERGHVFTDRLFHVRGKSETLLLGAATMREAVRDLLPSANIVTRPRLSKLSYAGQKKVSRLPRRSAIVAFSAADVYAIAELVRRQRGGAAVVLGALSPKTRNAQVELYQNGDVDFLVATDAIGMGLNLDLDHVAFAAIRKFDGVQNRSLTPAEIGQIAGRAGRHMNDGGFGVTARVEPFSAELVNALEAHEFEPVKVLQWRSRDLDFTSLDRLKASLQTAPDHWRLAKARMVDDVIALEMVSGDQQIAALARAPAALRRLWDVCQIPDYRKISTASHAGLLADIYRHLMSDTGLIDEDWFAAQVAFADRTDGDIDTLANRIAHIRTWTFVSHRSDWLAHPDHWQDRTREIEDKLSDALHERLTGRFVDRRTSVLMRRLRDQDELFAEIEPDGSLFVERHFVGRLKGFSFTPDTSSADIHGKAARHAAARVLTEELSSRTAALTAAPADAFVLRPGGLIEWRGEAVARLEKGETALRPVVQLLADEHLSAADRPRVEGRLKAWIEGHVTELLKPLVDLHAAVDISGLARGIAFRLSENLGVLKRDDVAEEVRSLDQEARGQLRKHGVRFGAFNIFVPALLKPAPSDLALLLWAIHSGDQAGVRADALPEPPRQGLTSAAADPALPETFYRIAGFHHCGRRVVRIDMLERLADMIRPLVAWREGAGETAPPSQANGPDEATPLGAAPPAGATGDGGFRVQPEMLSIIGCSGEDFAEVLRTLGFRLERRPGRAAAPAAAAETAVEEPAPAQDQPHDTQATATPEERRETGTEPPAAAPAEPAFDEIWRPRRKKDRERPDGRPPARKGKGKSKSARMPVRGKGRKKPDDTGPGRGPRRTAVPKPERPPDPDSPFAKLAALKRRLEEGVEEPAGGG